MEGKFSRTEMLIGNEGMKKLNDAKVAVFGIGGVGSFVCEGLARSGIGNFILVDYDKIDKSKNTYIYSQTTKSLEGYKQIVEAIKSSVASDKVCESFNTVCGQVANRMNGIGEFAKSHELIFFVCGSKSSNGKILFNECKRINDNAHQIEGPEDINFELTNNVASIGICGATSTPKWLMENCKQAITNYNNR